MNRAKNSSLVKTWWGRDQITTFPPPQSIADWVRG